MYMQHVHIHTAIYGQNNLHVHTLKYMYTLYNTKVYCNINYVSINKSKPI